jgi:hypothetical protein
METGQADSADGAATPADRDDDSGHARTPMHPTYLAWAELSDAMADRVSREVGGMLPGEVVDVLEALGATVMACWQALHPILYAVEKHHSRCEPRTSPQQLLDTVLVDLGNGRDVLHGAHRLISTGRHRLAALDGVGWYQQMTAALQDAELEREKLGDLADALHSGIAGEWTVTHLHTTGRDDVDGETEGVPVHRLQVAAQTSGQTQTAGEHEPWEIKFDVDHGYVVVAGPRAPLTLTGPASDPREAAAQLSYLTSTDTTPA